VLLLAYMSLTPTAGPSDEKIGVGMVLKLSASGFFSIVGLIQGSPAELSGHFAAAGCLLCEVDGHSLHNLEAKEVTEMILGPINSHVTLSIKQDSPVAHICRFTLTRAPAIVRNHQPQAPQTYAQQQQQQQQHSSFESKFATCDSLNRQVPTSTHLHSQAPMDHSFITHLLGPQARPTSLTPSSNDPERMSANELAEFLAPQAMGNL
jgi:hypothetical protein